MRIQRRILRALILIALVKPVLGQSTARPVSTPQTEMAEDFKGANAGEKIAAAIGALRASGVVDATTLQEDFRITVPLKVTKPITLRLPAQTLVCSMPDPGIGSGCIDVLSDNVTIEGVPGATVLTQPNGQNIQTAIHIGRIKQFTLRGVTINWNEGSQLRSGRYYAGIRSSTGASDIRIEGNEFTACGDRAIDLRATSHSWISHNYFHQTGINVGGRGGAGNAISVDVNGTTSFSDTWLVDNRIEEWGDAAVACPHGSHCHVVGNIMRGRLDFGHAPSKIEGGIDIVGCTECDVVDNKVINVFGFSLDAESQEVGGVTYVPANVRIVGNEFRHSPGADYDPLVNIGSALAAGQLTNIIFTGNSFEGVRLAIGDVTNAVITGNTFQDICTKFYSAAIVLSQSTGRLQDVTIVRNSFSTKNSSIKAAVLAAPSVTDIGHSFIGQNDIQPSIKLFQNLSRASIVLH